MLKDITVLYLKKDYEIDKTLFKNCLETADGEGAIQTFDTNEIGVVVCDLECGNIDTFIEHIKKKHKDFPLFLLEKTPKRSYKFSITGKILKPFNLDGFRRKIKNKEKEIVGFYEKNLLSNLSVADSIMSFFTDKNRAVEEIMSTTNITKEMDFEILKNFIYTAYNNFVFLDKKIDKGELKKVKENYEKIQRMYRNLLKSTDKGIKELYKFIFLENHYEYKKLKTQLENGKNALLEFQKKVKRINDRSLEIQKELDKSRSSEDVGALESEKKSLKGSYTDTVHNISLIQDTNHELVKNLEAIEKEYFDEFKSEFASQKEEIKKKYRALLNKFTYHFNRQLWLEAKKSRMILEHYENGQVDGFLNSKTYLEYYLANIDASKAGENTKKMVNYIKNYNKYNKVNVAFLTTDEDMFFEYSNVARRIDGSIFPYHYKRLVDFFKEYPKYNFEILVIDFYSDIIKSAKVLKVLKAKLPDNLIFTTFAPKNPDADVVSKNFSTMNRSQFQKDFKLIL